MMKWLCRLRALLDRMPNRISGRTTFNHMFLHPEAATQSRLELTREDVVRMVAKNGGPEGLCLAGYDLSGVNLAEMNLRGVVFGTSKFAGYERISAGAILKGTWLQGSDLTRANLARTNLEGAHCWQTIFYEADIHATNLRGASLGKADLRRTDLYGSDLRDANLEGAQLQGANLCGVQLTGALLSADSVGTAIIQETQGQYAEYFGRPYVEPETRSRYRDRHLKARLVEAKDIYRSLKNAFLGSGRYDDASWAYIKERQMERKTHWPPKWARNCYPNELERLSTNNLKRRWQLLGFYVRHLFAYIADWLAELTCGYGEKPLRTLICALAFIFIFSLLYWLSGGVVFHGGEPLAWLDYLNYSFGAFTTMGFSSFDTITPLAQTLTSLEALSGISLLALLMFTLGNRIKRS